MFSGERNLSDWHDASAWAGGSHPTTEARGAEYAGGDNPAVDNADATWDRATQSIADRLNAPDPRIRCNHGIIEVDHHHAVIRNAVG